MYIDIDTGSSTYLPHSLRLTGRIDFKKKKKVVHTSAAFWQHQAMAMLQHGMLVFYQ